MTDCTNEIRHLLTRRIVDLGAPDFTNAKAFVEWIESARSIAFLGGARHEQIRHNYISRTQRRGDEK